jgi:hypothetical protein
MLIRSNPYGAYRPSLTLDLRRRELVWIARTFIVVWGRYVEYAWRV